MDDPISTLALQIVQKASQPDIAVSDLAELAEGDAGFAVRLLSVVNSPIHGFSRRIVNVRQAASLLGARGLQNIALGLCVTGMTPLGPTGDLLMGLSLRRACAARRIAELCELPAAADHFATGLLLELGLLMLARDQIDRVAPLAKTPSNGRIVRERAAGFQPHPLAGGSLGRKWHLPDDMVRAIENHHEKQPLDSPLAKVAWVSERVSAVFEGGDTPALRGTALSALGNLGLDRKASEGLLAELPERVQQASSAFGRGVGKNPPLEKVLSDANTRLVELNLQYQELVRTMEDLLVEKEQLVEQLRTANEHLEELAARDGLTKLLNRRAFMELGERELARARRESGALALVLFDVDHFKKVNDTHGHPVGDAVLRVVAQTAHAVVPEGEIVGRYGGEEFGVVLRGPHSQRAVEVADQLREAIAAALIEAEGITVRVTASFGVSRRKHDDAALAELIKRADLALYEAKRGGRNRVVHGD